MKGITATIITLNEEKNIRECIESIAPVCNEIIVVDSKSTDKTVEIAKSLNAKVYTQEYLGDGPQKHYGVQYASNDWILSLDADERLNQETIESIRNIDFNKTDCDAYSFPRKNFVGKMWLKAAGWYPDEVVRLYNKNKAQYLNKKAHSYVEAKNVKRLRSHILHYTYKNYSHWIERINALSSRDAWAMYEKGVKVNAATPITHAAFASIKKYLFQLGFLQGMNGATVTITTAFHVYMKYAKLIELKSKD